LHVEFVTKFPPIVPPPSIPPIGGKEETAGWEESIGKKEVTSIDGTIPCMKAPRFGGLGGKAVRLKDDIGVLCGNVSIAPCFSAGLKMKGHLNTRSITTFN